MMTTRIPNTPAMAHRGGQALYEQYREIEGRVLWEEAAPWVREPYEQKARIVLETAIPQDPKFLRQFSEACLEAAEII